MAEKKKILIIEDDWAIAQMYSLRLQEEGYEVLLSKDGSEGLKAADEQKPVLILLDIIMPKLDGFGVLERLKANVKTKNIPVVLLTNLGQDEDVKKGKFLGAQDYLIKSNFTPSQVMEKVKRLIK